jgi:hypothetical protein
MSRFLHLLGFSVSFVLKLETSRTVISISRLVFYFFITQCISSRFAGIVRSVITDTSHMTVVPLTFMTIHVCVLSNCRSPVTPYVYISSSGCNQPSYCV